MESDAEISFTAATASRVAARPFSTSGLDESSYTELSARTYVRVMVGSIRKMAGYAVWMFSPALMILTCSPGGMDKCRG